MINKIEEYSLSELITYLKWIRNANPDETNIVVNELVRSRKRVLALWNKYNDFFINNLWIYLTEDSLIKIINSVKNVHTLTKWYFELTKFILEHKNTTNKVLIELLKSQNKKWEWYFNLVTVGILKSNKLDITDIELKEFVEKNYKNKYLTEFKDLFEKVLKN